MYITLCSSGINKNLTAFPEPPIGASGPQNHRVFRETQHVGRTLLWKTAPEIRIPEPEIRKTDPSPKVSMCPVLVNQSESIRLDNQLRGWFRLGPETLSNMTHVKAPASAHRKGGSSSNTALDHYTRPAVHSLTGSIYHMLLSERELRSSKYP
jgi:hypothetical protein